MYDYYLYTCNTRITRMLQRVHNVMNAQYVHNTRTTDVQQTLVHTTITDMFVVTLRIINSALQKKQEMIINATKLKQHEVY